MNDDGLKLLILGQHIGISRLNNLRNLDEIFNYLHQWETELPPIHEPADSGKPFIHPSISWLIALNLAIGSPSLVDLKLLFQDPELYAMHVKPNTGMVTGFEFDITYRRIDEKLGVYQTDIQLPPEMRHFMVSGFTVTLPNIGITVYTNGDFQLDIGFPWDLDFSRSFTVEGYIAPGIPVLGGGGFYIGRFKAHHSNLLPEPERGTFGPALTFGFGMQLGIGKSFEIGPLKAGFSLTAVGILEGVMAPWQPSLHNDLPSSNLSNGLIKQDEYYYRVTGTAGIVGKLFGYVDFFLVKGDVNIDLSLLTSVTVEAYTPIPIEVHAEVDVSASIRVGWGIFKHTFHFAYRASIRENAIIETSGTPPWKQSQLNRISPSTHQTLHWEYLLSASEGNKKTIKTCCVPLLTISETFASVKAPSFVALLMIEAPNQQQMTVDLDQDERTSLQVLAEQILIWIVAAGGAAPKDEKTLLLTDVSRSDLEAWYCFLTESDEQLPIPPEEIESFMKEQFCVDIHQTPTVSETTNEANPMSFFPMIPGLILLLPGESPIDFGEYNRLSISDLDKYHQQLEEVRVAYEQSLFKSKKECQTEENTSQFVEFSAATWVWADYFTAIAKFMLKAGIDVLKDPPSTRTLNDLLECLRINQIHNQLTGLLSRQFLHGLHYLDSASRSMELFKLTGQQFILPTNPENFEFSLKAPDRLDWVTFK